MNLETYRQQFEDEYRWLNPPPARATFTHRSAERGPWMGRAWTIAFIVAASVLISGLRTASLFAALANAENAPALQVVEGLAAVALVELGIVLTGFRAEKLRQESLDKPRHVASLRDLWRGVKVRLGRAAPLTHAQRPEPSIIPPLHNVLFWAALAANVWVSLQVALRDLPGVTTLDPGAFVGSLPGQPVQTLAMLLIAVVVGAVPPIAAKAAGEAAARDLFQGREDEAEVEQQYQEALAAWQTNFKAAWTREKNKLSQAVPPVPVQNGTRAGQGTDVPSVPAQNGTRVGLGTDVPEGAVQFADSYRDDPDLTIRERAMSLGVSKTTVQRWKQAAESYGLLDGAHSNGKQAS
ncbi:MAG: hypothetical protein JXB47_09940, partial [Anaerolineae bacterium]|nr:hypothetical protein [Anaerolineae bacterium]